MESFSLDIMGTYAIVSDASGAALARVERPAGDIVVLTFIERFDTYLEAYDAAVYRAALDITGPEPEPEPETEPGPPLIEGEGPRQDPDPHQ